jgi:hypothetical protein
MHYHAENSHGILLIIYGNVDWQHMANCPRRLEMFGCLLGINRHAIATDQLLQKDENGKSINSLEISNGII